MNNAVEYNTVVGISSDYFVSLGKKNIPANSILITTPGKVIFNETLPNDFDYINNAKNLSLNGDDIVSKGESPAKAIEKYVPHAAVTKSNLSNIVQKLNDKYETEQVAEYMDNIKNTGFKMCTKSGITMSIFDLPEYTGKEKFISAGEEEIVDYKNDFDLGLSNDNERYIKVIQI
jgi:DNA-directed RNA polymerase subunit beta'